jgi:hypothetical protein
MKGYFSHDMDARHNPKIRAVRRRHGMEGYGVYFAILEMMRGTTSYMCPVAYEDIAYEICVTPDLVKSVVEDFGLFGFTEDGKSFYSESFLERMTIKDGVSAKRSQAAKTRWNADKELDESNSNANAMQMQSKCNARKEKKSKGNERELKEIEGKGIKDVCAVALPLLGGGEWQVDPEFFGELERTYTVLKIPDEFMRMRTWCLSNPQKCKTRRGIKAFVNKWLRKDDAEARAKGVSTGERAKGAATVDDVNWDLLFTNQAQEG